MKKESRRICWFFTNRQLVKISVLFFLGVFAQAANVAINLKFLAAQQAVQNGNMEMWEGYLVSLLVLSVFNVGSVLYMKYFFDTLSRYLNFNLFDKYQECFKVYEKGVLMKYHIIYAALSLPLAILTAMLGIFTIVKTMEMVNEGQAERFRLRPEEPDCPVVFGGRGKMLGHDAYVVQAGALGEQLVVVEHAFSGDDFADAGGQLVA